MTRSLPPPPRPSPPTFNSHSPAAPAANASGFLLTALSNARPNLGTKSIVQAQDLGERPTQNQALRVRRNVTGFEQGSILS
jgi:hypothetical protein